MLRRFVKCHSMVRRKPSSNDAWLWNPNISLARPTSIFRLTIYSRMTYGRWPQCRRPEVFHSIVPNPSINSGGTLAKGFHRFEVDVRRRVSSGRIHRSPTYNTASTCRSFNPFAQAGRIDTSARKRSPGPTNVTRNSLPITSKRGRGRPWSVMACAMRRMPVPSRLSERSLFSY